jgi:hypothetical protein
MRELELMFIKHRYFWTEIWKRERGSGGRNWLETPRVLCASFSPRRCTFANLLI